MDSRRSRPKNRRRGLAKAASVETGELGDAWLSIPAAVEKLHAIPDTQNDALGLIARALEQGKITLFVESICFYPADWHFRSYTMNDASKEGLLHRRLAGPTLGSVGLSANFWRNGEGALDALARYVDEGSRKLTLYCPAPAQNPKDFCPYWEIEGPAFSTLQIEALEWLKQIERLGPLEPKDLGGARRLPKWRDWTAYLVEYARATDLGHAPEHRKQLAKEICQQLDHNLAFAGKGKVNAPDARAIVEAVLEHMADITKKRQKT